MSSLAAARADNFYHPPDFDPKKHKSLNKVRQDVHTLTPIWARLESDAPLQLYPYHVFLPWAPMHPCFITVSMHKCSYLILFSPCAVP